MPLCAQLFFYDHKHPEIRERGITSVCKGNGISGIFVIVQKLGLSHDHAWPSLAQLNLGRQSKTASSPEGKILVFGLLMIFLRYFLGCANPREIVSGSV